MTKSDAPIEISFADAYDQLKEITGKLNNDEEVEADELVDLLRRGKGLEAVLREHLTNIEQEVTAIEGGDGITPYRIIAGAEPEGVSGTNAAADTSELAPATQATGDDDIPF